MMAVPASAPPAWLLVSAHHCAPGMGSEHAVGWQIVSRLAAHVPILLITQDNEYRPAVEAGCARLRAQGCRIEPYFVVHGQQIDGRRNQLRIGYYLSYIGYQRRVRALAEQLLQTHPIAACHHLTIVGFREPGFLWQLPVPFLWGPVGGLIYHPRRLSTIVPLKTRAILAVRGLITTLQFHLSPRVRQAYRATQRAGGAFVAATPDIGQRFQRRFGGQFHWIPETGCTPHPPAAQARPGTHPAPLRLLWLGALIDRKPMDLLLRAIQAVPDHARRVALTVVGDGDSRARYEALAAQSGVSAQFVGWVDHDRVSQHFAQADLFTLISLTDLTTNVVPEALSHGLPVLCLDHHGYSYLLDDSCAVRVPLGTPDEVIQRLTQAIDALCDAPQRLAAMGRAARERADRHSWARHAEQLLALLPATLRHPPAPLTPPPARQP